MLWAEVDGGTWTVPAERMKTGRSHRVPLSAQARAVLDQARKLSRGKRVFPISESTMRTAMRRGHLPKGP